MSKQSALTDQEMTNIAKCSDYLFLVIHFLCLETNENIKSLFIFLMLSKSLYIENFETEKIIVEKTG